MVYRRCVVLVLSRIEQIDKFFDNVHMPLEKQTKFVASGFKEYAAYWWERLQNQRVYEGKSKIRTWRKKKSK